MVQRGNFRTGLYYRLNTMVIHLPPLRERGADIKLLAMHFLSYFVREFGRPPPEISPAVRQLMNAYHWPGNVRELRNAMERAALLCLEGPLEPGHLPPSIGARGPGSRQKRKAGKTAWTSWARSRHCCSPPWRV